MRRQFDDLDFEFEDEPDPTHADPDALRILATWITMHTGEDPRTHAVIERGFVVREVRLTAA